MNNNNHIEFKKERTLGSIVTDSFKFIRLEWKGFFWMVFKNSFVPFVFFILAFVFYFNAVFTTATASLDDPYGAPDLNFEVLFLYILIMLVTGLLSYIFMHLSALFYIKEYIENQGVVRSNEVWSFIQEKFWSFLGLSILVIFGFGISFFLCILPVIYTWPVLTLMPVIFVFTNKGAFDTFGFAWNFVSGKYWADSWGIMFVIALLVGVLGYVFSIPAIMYQLIEMFSGIRNNDPSQMFDFFSNPVYVALLIFSYLGRFLLYGITLVSNVFIYYDIDEQINGTGAIERIDNLGQ